MNMKTCLCFVLISALGLSITACSEAPNTEEQLFSHPTQLGDRLVLGRTEMVEFNDIEALQGVGFPAKIDTGADSTSIHALNVRIVPRDPMFDGLEGDELIEAIMEEYNQHRHTQLRHRDDLTDIMVEFDIPNPKTGKLASYKTPLLRIARVKARDSDNYLYRPVVVMPLTIAGLEVDTEVNLADRSQFSVPILIGKTFLRNNAWVDASYDYLQLQDDARVIGRRERAAIYGTPIDVSVSLANRYSALHGENIVIDHDTGMVQYTLRGRDGSQATMHSPLIRMAKFSAGERPLVYVPVHFGVEKTTDFVQAYVTDRSHSSTALRLGVETLNRMFFVDITKTNLTADRLKTIRQLAEEDDLFVVSPQERVSVDGIEVIAEPALAIKRSVLEVNNLEERPVRQANFQLVDVEDTAHALSKPVASRLKSKEGERLTIDSQVAFHSNLNETRLTLEESDGEEPNRLRVSPSMLDGSLLVNTRSTQIFDKQAPIQAGFVEMVELDSLSFPAKLDTGADVSSISAEDIQIFEKNGQAWVKFTYRNAQGDEHYFEKKVFNKMRIRAREGELTSVRPVVKMRVKLGDIDEMIDVNLRDRSNFEYSMILGRNFLNNNIVVSSDRPYIYTQAPD